MAHFSRTSPCPTTPAAVGLVKELTVSKTVQPELIRSMAYEGSISPAPGLTETVSHAEYPISYALRILNVHPLLQTKGGLFGTRCLSCALHVNCALRSVSIAIDIAVDEFIQRSSPASVLTSFDLLHES